MPAPTMKKTPGNNFEIGNSAKKTHPRKIDNGMPKYSNGAIMDGSVIRQAEIRHKTPQPPLIPMKEIRRKSATETIGEQPEKIINKVIAEKSVIA